MSDEIVQCPIFGNNTVHCIMTGNKKPGIKIGLKQYMKIEKRIEKIKFNKKQAVY